MTGDKTPGRQVSRPGLKVATFTVKADAVQSSRWKQAAEAEGFSSVGAWLARAADAYLKARATAGNPIPLAWRLGRFSARLEGGELVMVKGQLSPPFGAFAGTPAGPASYAGAHRYTLVYLPDGRLVATMRTSRECKALASELARVLVRWDGKGEPPGKPAEEIVKALR